MKLGDLIKKRREELNLTQEELADLLNYKSKSTINKIEKNINDIPFSKLEDFAKVLKVDLAYLLGWDIEKKEKSITKASKDIEPTIEEIRAKLNESELIELDTLITLNTTMFQKRGDLKDYTKEQVIKALTIAFYDTLPRLNDNK